jgi:hypothetical protein
VAKGGTSRWVRVIGGASLDRARRRWWLWAAAVLGGLVGLTAVVLLVWLAPPALYKNIPAGKDRAGAEAATRTGLIAGLAGLAAQESNRRPTFRPVSPSSAAFLGGMA